MFDSLLAPLPLRIVRMSPARQTTSRLALARQPLWLGQWRFFVKARSLSQCPMTGIVPGSGGGSTPAWKCGLDAVVVLRKGDLSAMTAGNGHSLPKTGSADPFKGE
jgi:hypothetical protein